MKKVIIIGAMALSMVGCTNMLNGGNAAPQPTAKEQLISQGMNMLLSPNEINAGNKAPISLDNVSQGMLGAAGLESLFGENQAAAKIAHVMAANQGQVMETENPNMLIQAIKYLGQTEKGKSILAKGKYIFKNYSPVSKKQIEQLAQLYKFRYAFAN